MANTKELKVRERDRRFITEDRKLKLLADGKALGLRLVCYTDRISAESFIDNGMPFGTDLGAHEMDETLTPLLSANHDGTLRYQQAGDPDSVTATNIELLATRERLISGWSTCTMLIVFPDDPNRYREISQLQANRAPDNAYTAEEIYVTLTIKWLNNFIDFSPDGKQLIPRSFIGGFIDLDKKELVRNIHYSETFIQSADAKSRLPNG